MRPLLCVLATIAGLALVGCGHLDMTPEGDPSRVVTGEVAFGEDIPLPADAVVTVRIVDASAVGAPPLVLGSQTINNPGVAPVAFRIEYRADDDTLRRGLNLEARISYAGKIQYFNLNRYVVTPGNSADTHRITVNRAGP
jgi:uncharacterized lipoprotein YbaY